MEARGSSASSSSFRRTPEQVYGRFNEQRNYVANIKSVGLTVGDRYTVFRQSIMRRWSLTERRQAFVQNVVEGPDVGGPVGMTEAPLKGEETGQDLRELTLK